MIRAVESVSDRPEVLRVDNENRPHCENGPSHRWRDGWSLYYWHGVEIPGEWVSGKPPSAQEALTWPNIEQRRAAAEIVGWANILAQLDARVHMPDAPREVEPPLSARRPSFPSPSELHEVRARRRGGREREAVGSLDAARAAQKP